MRHDAAGQVARAAAWLADSSAAVAVAVLGVAIVALPITAGAVATTMVALAAAVVLTALAARSRGALPLSALVPLAALTALAAWMTLAAALAVEPRVSLFGIVAQHSGALLWVTGAALAWASASVAGPKGLRRLVAAVAVLGGVLGFGALLDAAGLLGSQGRFSVEPSGFLESSLSLGQVLVLALACAVAWLLLDRRTEIRIAAGACAVLAATGLVLARSRSAWIAVVVALAVSAIAHRAGPRARRVLAIALAVFALSWVAVLPAALDGRLGPGTASVLAAGNERATIWRAAYAVAGQDLTLGRGPDRFSAWVAWDAPTADAIRSNAAYDPHDTVLSWLVAGGIPGLLLGVAAFALAFDALLRGPADRGGPAAAALVGGLVAWAVTLRFAWIAPPGAALAALLAGTLLGAAGRRDEAPAWPRRLSAVTAAVLAVVLAACAYPAFVELRWAVRDHTRTADAATLEADLAAWPDPDYARVAMEKRLAAGSDADIEAARATAAAVAPQLTAHVDAALTSARVAQLYGIRTGVATREDFEAAIDAGKLADPASGLWDYVAALEAARRDDAAGVRARAESALEYPLPAVAEEWLRAQLRTAEP